LYSRLESERALPPVTATVWVKLPVSVLQRVLDLASALQLESATV